MEPLADPLLQDLCKICHTNPPKYKCPRCFTATCSLICVRRHKQWDECSGVRDPAEYLKRKDLATAEAFDKDFNFLSNIERLFERSERLREQRGLPPLGDTVDVHTKGRKGHGKGRAEELLQERFREAGVTVVKAPLGLSRNKQNQTHWHKKFGCINWTVEWILPDGSKAISKCYETASIGAAYTNLENNKLKRKRGNEHLPDNRAPRIAKTSEAAPVTAGATVSANPKPLTVQSVAVETTAEKASSDGEAPLPLLDEVKSSSTDVPAATHEQPANDKPGDVAPPDLFFYLHRPQKASKVPVLVPVSSTQTLREGLKDATVLEFPTIYVLRSSPETIQQGDHYLLEKDYHEKSDQAASEESSNNAV